MLSHKVATKYSQALFMAAKDRGLIDKAYDQLRDLRDFVVKDRTLLNFLNAPQALDEHKTAMVRDVFGERLEKLFVEFIVVLVEKHRIAFLPVILDEFEQLVEAEKGIGRATVVTALPLTDAERDQLRIKLTAKTQLQILLEERIDKSILGGIIVLLQDELIDGSVRRGLDLMEARLNKVRVV